MKEEIKTLVSSKYQHLPEPMQHYLDGVFHRVVVAYDQKNISMGAIASILNSVEFLLEMEDNDAYVLAINYNPLSLSIPSIPTWKIFWRKGGIDEEVSRIDEILGWIFESHPKIVKKCGLPKFFSRCQEKKVFFTELNGQSINLPVRDIIYFMAEGEYTRVYYGHRRGLQSILVDISMRSAESIMEPYRFYRIHRSYMVNLGCIRSVHITKSLHKIALCSGTELPIARRRKNALQDWINSLAFKQSDHLYK